MVVEHALHDRLTVVEASLDRQRMHIVFGRGGHHSPLHGGHATLWKEHENVGVRSAPEGLDRGAASVARGRNHNGRALAARSKRMVHELCQELHRQILECKGWPMKQLEQEFVDAELHERSNGRMAEIAVGLARHAGEIVLRDGIADKRTDQLDGDFRIGPAGEAGNDITLELRP